GSFGSSGLFFGLLQRTGLLNLQCLNSGRRLNLRKNFAAEDFKLCSFASQIFSLIVLREFHVDSFGLASFHAFESFLEISQELMNFHVNEHADAFSTFKWNAIKSANEVDISNRGFLNSSANFLHDRHCGEV